MPATLRVSGTDTFTSGSTVISNGTTWGAWNDQYIGTACTVTTINSIASNVIWNQWNDQYQNTATITTGSTSNVITIWENWNQTYGTAPIRFIGSAPARPQTPEEIEAVRLADEERKQRYAEEERLRKVAQEKAEQLLLENLDEIQKDTLKKKNCFYMYTQSGKKYRIERGRSRNVRLVDETDKVLKTYCAHPGEQVPDADTMLAQKLCLEANEPEFLKIANAS